jgi:CrcB protein
LSSGLWSWALVAAGGAVGSCTRHAASRLVALLPAAATAFPWATLGVNVAGCFLIGWWLPALRARGPAGEDWRLLLVVGGLGGFTTYSAFAHETLDLWRGGAAGTAVAYAAASLVLGLLAVAGGAAVQLAFD